MLLRVRVEVELADGAVPRPLLKAKVTLAFGEPDPSAAAHIDVQGLASGLASAGRVALTIRSAQRLRSNSMAQTINLQSNSQRGSRSNFVKYIV